MKNTVKLMASTLSLSDGYFDKAYKALCALNEQNSLKMDITDPWSSSLDSTGAVCGRAFKGLPWNFPDLYPDLLSLLEAMGFKFWYEKSVGNLYFTDYHQDLGQIDLFLSTLAPYLSSGVMHWYREEKNFFTSYFFLENSMYVSVVSGQPWCYYDAKFEARFSASYNDEQAKSRIRQKEE